MILPSLVFAFLSLFLDLGAGFGCGVARFCFSRILALFSRLAMLGVKAKGLSF